PAAQGLDRLEMGILRAQAACESLSAHAVRTQETAEGEVRMGGIRERGRADHEADRGRDRLMMLWKRLAYLLPWRRRAAERDMRDELQSIAAMARPGEL